MLTLQRFREIIDGLLISSRLGKSIAAGGQRDARAGLQADELVIVTDCLFELLCLGVDGGTPAPCSGFSGLQLDGLRIISYCFIRTEEPFVFAGPGYVERSCGLQGDTVAEIINRMFVFEQVVIQPVSSVISIKIFGVKFEGLC